MTNYSYYPSGTKVKIKDSNEIGEAFESAFGIISVFLGEDKKCQYFKIEDVEFLDTAFDFKFSNN
jgi:hypothetical protein